MQHLTSFSVLRSTQVKVALAIQVSTFRPLLYSNTTIILSLHPEPNLSLSSHRCGQWVSHPVSHLVKTLVFPQFFSSLHLYFVLCLLRLCIIGQNTVYYEPVKVQILIGEKNESRLHI